MIMLAYHTVKFMLNKPSGSSAVFPGAADLLSCAQLSATGLILLSGTSIWDFALPRTFSFTFNLSSG